MWASQQVSKSSIRGLSMLILHGWTNYSNYINNYKYMILYVTCLLWSRAIPRAILSQPHRRCFAVVSFEANGANGSDGLKKQAEPPDCFSNGAFFLPWFTCFHLESGAMLLVFIGNNYWVPLEHKSLWIWFDLPPFRIDFSSGSKHTLFYPWSMFIWIAMVNYYMLLPLWMLNISL